MNAEEISKLNDFELNRTIAELLYPDARDFNHVNKSDVLLHRGRIVPYVFNYCNNWNDLMPLVVEHLSAFWKAGDLSNHYSGKWNAAYGCVLSPMVKWSNSPQRALAECLLLVLQDKK